MYYNLLLEELEQAITGDSKMYYTSRLLRLVKVMIWNAGVMISVPVSNWLLQGYFSGAKTILSQAEPRLMLEPPTLQANLNFVWCCNFAKKLWEYSTKESC